MVGTFTNKLMMQGEVMEAFGQSQYGEWGASWSVILHGCVIMPRHVINGYVLSAQFTRVTVTVPGF